MSIAYGLVHLITILHIFVGLLIPKKIKFRESRDQNLPETPEEFGCAAVPLLSYIGA